VGVPHFFQPIFFFAVGDATASSPREAVLAVVFGKYSLAKNL
jgi:hypothetical protein